MVDAVATLILDAKDNASAQVARFGGTVEQAGQKAQIAGAKTQQMSTNVTGLMARVQAAQTPLRNLSAILGGFGLSFIGITAVTMGLRQLVGSVIANQQAFLTAQLTLRRFGMSMDDAYARVKAMQAVLGRTAMVELAGMLEAFEEWRLSMALTAQQGNEILGVLQQYATWAGVKLPDALKTLQDYQERFGKAEGLKRFTQAAKDAEASASDMQRAWVRWGELMGPVFEGVGLVALEAATNIVQIFDPESYRKEWEETKKLYALMWEDFLAIPSRFATRWKGFTDSLGKDWRNLMTALGSAWEGLGLWLGGATDRMGAFFTEKWAGIIAWWGNLMGDILGFFRETWEGFATWWGELIGNIGAFFVERWTAIGEWWGRLATGIGDFWGGVWEGMKGVAISVYNFIADRMNDAIGLVNSIIQMINRALGLIGVRIPEIGLRIAHATLPAPEVRGPGPVFTAPLMPTGAGGTIIIPVYIGDKRLTEIIVDSLTGAVRQRELAA